jgi:hypothetical protein
VTPEYHRNYLNQGDNRDRHNQRVRSAYAKNPRGYKAAKHKYRYGESLEETEARFVNQGLICAACGADDPGSKTGWHTDHNHKTKTVRGVLCSPCNRALGYAKEDPRRLRLLASYLEKHNGI